MCKQPNRITAQLIFVKIIKYFFKQSYNTLNHLLNQEFFLNFAKKVSHTIKLNIHENYRTGNNRLHQSSY